MAAPGRRYLACWPGARGAVGGLSLELGAQRRSSAIVDLGQERNGGVSGLASRYGLVGLGKRTCGHGVGMGLSVSGRGLVAVEGGGAVRTRLVSHVFGSKGCSLMSFAYLGLGRNGAVPGLLSRYGLSRVGVVWGRRRCH